MLRILLALVAVAATAVVIIVVCVDEVAESLLERSGSDALGVEVTVESVDLGIIDDRSVIRELAVANPASFAAPHLLRIEEISAAAGLRTLLGSGAVEIDTLVLRGIHLDLEKHGDSSNIETIIEHVQRTHVDSGDPEDRPLKIGRLVFEDITVTARGEFASVQTGTVAAHIDRIVLEDVDSMTDGSQLVQVITSALTVAILEQLAQHPVEGFSRATLGQVAKLIDDIPIVGDIGVGDAIQGVVEELGGTIDDALDGIGDLLRGD